MCIRAAQVDCLRRSGESKMKARKWGTAFSGEIDSDSQVWYHKQLIEWQKLFERMIGDGI